MIEPIARMRIELQDIEPKVWRRVDVPLSSTLAALHEIIQVTMGWHDAHLFEFRIGDRIYGGPDSDEEMYDRRVYQARSTRLQSLVARGVGRFLYIYDFGDSWQHDIVIEEVRNGEADIDYPVFIDGARRCPPEDVGGPPGFMDFLEAALNPAHAEHRRMIEWYGGPFDPRDFNDKRVQRIMTSFAGRRRGPLARHRAGRQDKQG